MPRLFFTSDLHFGHGAIMKHCSRYEFISEEELNEIHDGKLPIFSQESIERMNLGIIDAINSVVERGDILYILGDFVIPRAKIGRNLANRVRELINCRQIHLILGNHDDWYSSSSANLFVSVDKMKTIRVNGQKIILCHYPLKTWESCGHGSWNLFGHLHGNLPDDPFSLSMDVGVDARKSYVPWSFEEILECMEKKLASKGDSNVLY